MLPLGRVVNDEKVTDHHAIIPTRAEHHPVDKMDDDDRRIYDMVVRRFLAVFHPEAVFENTRVETTVDAPRRCPRRSRVPHARQAADGARLARGLRRGWPSEHRERGARRGRGGGADQQLPRLEQGEQVEHARASTSARKETKPPRRYSDASLLGAMETAGKLVDDDELREAMKDSGIGTPATRAAIIERLITVGYIERDGRALVATEKGMNVIRLLDEHALTSPGLTGSWEHRLGKIERGEDSRKSFMSDIAEFAEETVNELDDELKDVRIPRANLGPCPVCGHDIVENRKGYSCWSREDPGCGFVIWKSKAGKQLPLAVARELIKTGYTERRHRLQGPQRAQLPRPPGARPDRRGKMAGGVRRAVGQGGRQAARHRRAAGRGSRPRRGRRCLRARRRAHRRLSQNRRFAAPGHVPRVRQDWPSCP